MTELLCCPFCGGEAFHSTGKNPDGLDWHYIECVECAASADNAEIWNRRAAPAVDGGELSEIDRYHGIVALTALLRDPDDKGTRRLEWLVPIRNWLLRTPPPSSPCAECKDTGKVKEWRDPPWPVGPGGDRLSGYEVEKPCPKCPRGATSSIDYAQRVGHVKLAANASPCADEGMVTSAGELHPLLFALDAKVHQYTDGYHGALRAVNAALRAPREDAGRWQPIETAPASGLNWFWIRDKNADDANVYLDTSGRPILPQLPSAPREKLCERGHWSSLQTATHWRPYIPHSPPSGRSET